MHLKNTPLERNAQDLIRESMKEIYGDFNKLVFKNELDKCFLFISIEFPTLKFIRSFLS